MKDEYTGWLVSKNIFKRSLAVYGHSILGSLLITIPLVSLFIVVAFCVGAYDSLTETKYAPPIELGVPASTINATALHCVSQMEHKEFITWSGTYELLHPDVSVVNASRCTLSDETYLVGFAYYVDDGTENGQRGQSLALFNADRQLLKETDGLFEYTLGDHLAPEIDSVSEGVAKFHFASGDGSETQYQAYELSLEDFSFIATRD